MIQNVELRVLGEHTPRLENRHGDPWKRMDRTIPILTDRYPKSYPGNLEVRRLRADSAPRMVGADRGSVKLGRRWSRTRRPDSART